MPRALTIAGETVAVADDAIPPRARAELLAVLLAHPLGSHAHDRASLVILAWMLTPDATARLYREEHCDPYALAERLWEPLVGAYGANLGAALRAAATLLLEVHAAAMTAQRPAVPVPAPVPPAPPPPPPPRPGPRGWDPVAKRPIPTSPGLDGAPPVPVYQGEEQRQPDGAVLRS